MAVTIDEMQVDIAGAPAQPASAAPAASTDQPDMSGALELLRERAGRLRAD